MPTFDVHTPVGVNQIAIKKAIRAAVAEATRRGKLRPNSVDSLTGKNTRRQSGRRNARHSFRAVGTGRDRSEADPQGRRLREQEHPVFAALRAGPPGPSRTAIWRACASAILHAVWQAQGQGCAPGALGVCIGSDRAHGYVLAKNQLFRTLDDTNPVPELAKLEAEIMERSQSPSASARWASAASRR